MATEKDGGRTRRKAGTERDDDKRAERTVEKVAGPARDIPLVDIDPWGSFLEKFWEQTEGESVERHEGERKPAESAPRTRTKPGRKERLPRAS